MFEVAHDRFSSAHTVTRPGPSGACGKRPLAGPRLWSIVLAGGEGERLRPFVGRRLGRAVPKQYCTFVGTRSMFQHTLDRATQLSRPEHTLAVIAQAHRETALAQLAGRPSIDVIAQPINRDTAVGILLAVTHVYTHDPEAMVVVFPSDHFVRPEQQFLGAVRSAVTAAGQLEDQLVLLGVVPDGLGLDYGWITQGQELCRVGGHTVRSVRAFVEKPDLPEAERVRASGALWNTMVVANRQK